MHKLLVLPEDEMILLDDGQDWYKPGDTCLLEGYLPEDEGENPSFDLTVNGYTHDNFTEWSEMPTWLQTRFIAE